MTAQGRATCPWLSPTNGRTSPDLGDNPSEIMFIHLKRIKKYLQNWKYNSNRPTILVTNVETQITWVSSEWRPVADETMPSQTERRYKYEY